MVVLLNTSVNAQYCAHFIPWSLKLFGKPGHHDWYYGFLKILFFNVLMWNLLLENKKNKVQISKGKLSSDRSFELFMSESAE